MGHSIEKLKALNVKRLAKKRGTYGDGGGLYLRVGRNGARSSCSWVFRYTLAGKAHEMGLGSYRDISLAEAREAATAARKLKAKGSDPIAHRDAQRAQARIEAAWSVTFRHCAESYIAAHKAGWKSARHAAQWPATLNTHAFPIIGDVPVQAVDVAMVNRILQPIWTTKPETASRLRGRIEAILDWAKASGYREGENPARWKGHLENLFQKSSEVQSIKHHPALPYVEAPAFMEALRLREGTSARALEFLILTAARSGTVIGAQWAEIDIEKKLWMVPAKRMKGKRGKSREHRVPLSPRAIDILEALPREGVFVFLGTREGKPLSGEAMGAVLKRMGIKPDKAVAHGFRSTFKDWASETTNFPNQVSESALAHVVSDKVEAAYRRGDLFEKRRKLMDTWAAFCGTPHAAKGDVVPIRRPERAVVGAPRHAQ